MAEISVRDDGVEFGDLLQLFNAQQRLQNAVNVPYMLASHGRLLRESRFREAHQDGA